MLEHFEKAYVLEHLTAERGNVTKAAARMQLPRQTVYRLLSRHGLTPTDGGN
jgi:transcriptional regulator of acetoin/glycerol metabolism